MRTFKVHGKGIETGRKRTRTYRARDESHMRALAEADGTEVIEFEQLPRTPPTDPQMDYASRLGITIPAGADINDASNLISNAVEGDWIASEQERAIAKHFGVDVDPEDDRYLGTMALRERVASRLDYPKGTTRWLVLRIAQDRGGKCLQAIDANPGHPRIVEIAEELTQDESFLRSLKRRGLDAAPIEPDRTMAYREIVARLCPGSKAQPHRGAHKAQAEPQKRNHAPSSRESTIKTAALAGIILVILVIALL